MNSHPIWGALLRMVERRLHPKQLQDFLQTLFSYRVLLRYVSTAVFHLPHSILFLWPHRSHNVLRDTHTHTPPLHSWSNTISMEASWWSSNHFSHPVVPSFLASNRHERPPLVEDGLHCLLSPHDAIEALFAVNCITCITTSQKPSMLNPKRPAFFRSPPPGSGLSLRNWPACDHPPTHPLYPLRSLNPTSA